MAKKIITRTRKEVLQRWVKALRSGQYKQTTGELRGGDRFCCLGVLCDLARKDGGGDWRDERYQGSITEPPKRITDFVLGANGTSATKRVNELIDMNDNAGASFNEIAAHIERRYLPRA